MKRSRSQLANHGIDVIFWQGGFPPEGSLAALQPSNLPSRGGWLSVESGVAFANGLSVEWLLRASSLTLAHRAGRRPALGQPGARSAAARGRTVVHRRLTHGATYIPELTQRLCA